jgi:hypothetical protein
MLAVARSFVVVHNAMLAAAADAGTTLEGMLDAVDDQLAAATAEQQAAAAPDECQQPSASADAELKEPEAEDISYWELLESAWLQIAADMSTVMQAAIQQQPQQDPPATVVA